MRRYKMTPDGEKPVWASRKDLVRMGQEWAELHYRGSRADGQTPREPGPYGNTEHDQACARRWQILTGKFPSWYRAEGGAA